MKINTGMDIGNGYLKAILKNADSGAKAVAVDIPSATAVITSSADVRVTDPQAIDREISDIYNNTEAAFDSPLVYDPNSKVYVGRRAIRSGKSLQEFNLKDVSRTKSETELSAVLVLSTIAGKALSDYYAENGNKLPAEGEDIAVNVDLALSLPIFEYRVHRNEVPRRYMERPHTVTIYNFEKPIRVVITFDNVFVAPEGASAQFAIASKGDEFMSSLVNNMIESGVDMPPDITVEDITSAGGIIGIDIGEGTVNFPIYQDLRFNSDTSMTFNKGYGTVMDEAVFRLTQMNRPFATRKKLVEWMLETKDKPLKRAQYKEAEEVVAAEINIFTDELARQFAGVLERNGAFAEVIYVYGGGATPVRNSLYPKLMKVIKKTFGEGSFMPVLYLDSSYSRYLNRDGLYLLAASGNPESVGDLSSL